MDPTRITAAVLLLFVLRILPSDASTDEMAVIFKYDKWSNFLTGTWESLNSIYAYAITCNSPTDDARPPKRQAFIKQIGFDYDSVYLAQEPGVAIHTSRKGEFAFQYGEVVWRAMISPVVGTVNILRVGEFDGEHQCLVNVRWPGIELVITQTVEGPKTVATVYRAEDKPDQSNYGRNWNNFNCTVCGKDLATKFHAYTLRWSESEIVWSLDGIDIHRYVAGGRISKTSLPLAVATYREDGYEPHQDWRENQLVIQSVVVRQKRPIESAPAKVEYEDLLFDDFTNDGRPRADFWRLPRGKRTPDRAIIQNASTWYDPDCVDVSDGFLRIMVSQNASTEYNYSLGRIDSIGSEDAPRIVFDISHFSIIETRYYFDGVDYDQKLHERYMEFIGTQKAGEFHIYLIRWTETHVTWHIDGKQIFTLRKTTDQKFPSKPMHVSMTPLINQYLAPSNPSSGEHETYPSWRSVVMEIDYVKIRRALPNYGFWTPSNIAIMAASISLVVLVALLMFIKWRKRLQEKKRAQELIHEWESFSESPKLNRLLERFTQFLIIPSENLVISRIVLGRGAFGIVYKGTANGLPTTTRQHRPVAVKALLNPFDPVQQHLFHEEISVMAKIGRDVNVVGLLGIVLRGQPLLLLEYCRLGALLPYLKKHRDGLFYSHVDESGCITDFSDDDCRQQWLTVSRPVGSAVNGLEEQDIHSQMLSTTDLIGYSYQISRGMEYLNSRKVIHRDLAARNILLSTKHLLKISDFGLSKHGKTSYVSSNTTIAFPMLWMSPESLLDRVFSQKSDVWSFGVLLWEIFSLGNVPFANSGVSKFTAHAFGTWLAEGNRLERLASTPNSIHTLMESCWLSDTANRPTFTDLRALLDKVLNSTGQAPVYTDMGEENEQPIGYKSLQADIFRYFESAVEVEVTEEAV
ncbi:putative Vascular endothelial growth factor receptor 3 [Hypsibius exemplaris]|uniref:Vascular endothelial growth factor receptor 3 n=1 Tax=Hypsibius exemplaris TaxID=2072580 RepID=A0A1W0WWB8_HYPEX|nr:putative Vascular endothelial growth factor receptor 3 [Hypsibius exemplaris]